MPTLRHHSKLRPPRGSPFDTSDGVNLQYVRTLDDLPQPNFYISIDASSSKKSKRRSFTRRSGCIFKIGESASLCIFRHQSSHWGFPRTAAWGWNPPSYQLKRQMQLEKLEWKRACDGTKLVHHLENLLCAQNVPNQKRSPMMTSECSFPLPAPKCSVSFQTQELSRHMPESETGSMVVPGTDRYTRDERSPTGLGSGNASWPTISQVSFSAFPPSR